MIQGGFALYIIKKSKFLFIIILSILAILVSCGREKQGNIPQDNNPALLQQEPSTGGILPAGTKEFSNAEETASDSYVANQQEREENGSLEDREDEDEKPAELSYSYTVPKEAPVIVTGKKYYVSKRNGDDNNRGTFEKPFATISRAAMVMKAGDACYIREGVYREMIIPANSGTKDAPILFSSYNNEKVVVSGADPITTKWSIYDGKIYQADMNWTLGLGKDQVFVDGEAVVQARHPNEDIRSKLPVKYSPLFPTKGYYSIDNNFKTIIKSPHLSQEQKGYWKGGIYVGGHNAAWAWQSALITSSKKGQISVGNRTRTWWFPIDGHYSAEMSEGFITNHINALDSPGEWHIQDHKLYIWMPNGDSPASHTVEAKKRMLAFDLTNKKNIYIFGLEIFAASVTMARAENCTLDRCLASYTSHFLLFDDARDGFIDAGERTEQNSPMSGQAGIYVSGRDNKVINSTIRYSAGAGIILAGYGTVVENNIIHDVGYASTYVSGIFADDEFNNIGDKSNIKLGKYTIRYNTIYNTGRSAISFNSLGGNIAQYAGSEISYNQCFNTMLFTSDGGSFYAYGVNLGADGNRTQLHHNLFWNCFRKSGEGVIYSDNLVEGLDIHDNVVWSHPYSYQSFIIIKTDTTNKDNLPRNTGGNKNLGVKEWLPSDLPLSAYAGKEAYFTGAMHDEHPATESLPELPRAEPYIPPSGELPRDNWKASASSYYDEFTVPDKAIDDDDTYTFWRIEDAAQGPTDWFVLDLGTEQTFSRIIMKCSGYNSPRSYTVTVSNDGKTWSEPVAMGDSAQSELDIRLSSMQKARYVKISQYERTNPDWGQFWMIQDIELYTH